MIFWPNMRRFTGPRTWLASTTMFADCCARKGRELVARIKRGTARRVRNAVLMRGELRSIIDVIQSSLRQLNLEVKLHNESRTTRQKGDDYLRASSATAIGTVKCGLFFFFSHADYSKFVTEENQQRAI
jgi:hypothetical protein